MTTKSSFLSIGQPKDREFVSLWQQLQEWTGSIPWRCLATSDEFLANLASKPINWAVIWQRWSDEYSPQDVADLLAALPLCRVVCVTGPWCEADQRTRRVWPPALVVPWWRAERRLAREWTDVIAGGSGLPWTASREESWLWEQNAPVESLTDLRLCVSINDAAYAATLRGDIESRGGHMADESVDVIVIDADVGTEVADQRNSSVMQSRTLAVSAWSTADQAQSLNGVAINEIASKLESFTGGISRSPRDNLFGDLPQRRYGE